MANYKFVTKKEFDNFIKLYPRKLNMDISDIGIPPVISYNDFTLSNDKSMVAVTYLYSNNSNDLFYEPENKRVYKIINS